MSRGKCSRVFTAVLLVTTKPLEAAQQSEIENWLENGTAIECNTIEALERMTPDSHGQTLMVCG